MTELSAPISERRRAAAVAGHTGDNAAAHVLLFDPDPTVRALALGALARGDALTDAVFHQCASDPDPIVRRRVAELAGVSATEEGPRARLDINVLLDDVDASVVEVAAWAAGEREHVDVTTLDRLISLAFSDDNALVRESAVAALGAIGDERGLPAILHGCDDKPAIRRRAVLALAAFDGDDVDDALSRAENDRDWQVRQSALVLTRERGPLSPYATNSYENE